MEEAIVSSNAQSFFQFGVRSGSGISSVSFIQSESYSTTYTETTSGPATSVTVGVTRDSSIIREVFQPLMLSGEPDLFVRFGADFGGTTIATPWQNHIVTDLTLVPHGIGSSDGYRIKLETADVVFKLTRELKTAARSGTISDVVKRISDENKLSDPLIEPTSGRFSLIQSYQTDDDFIRSRLITRSLSKSGKSGYKLFARDGRLRFHTRNYSSSTFSIDYFASSSIDITQVDTSQRRFRLGSSVKLVSMDPVTGAIREFYSDPSSVVGYGNSYPARPGTYNSVAYHGSGNLDGNHITQCLYDAARSELYEVEVVIPNCVKVRSGDAVLLTVSQSESKRTAWSGYYYVAEIVHLINNGKLSSALTLRRGEQSLPGSSISSTSRANQGASVVSDPFSVSNTIPDREVPIRSANG